MASPGVWTDVRARIEAAASELGGVPFQWPNEPWFDPAPTFVSVDIESEYAAPIEIGRDAAWIEEGRVVFTVLVPEGTGAVAADGLGKAIVNVLRLGPPPHPVEYGRGAVTGAQAEGGTGGYFVRIAHVSYRYQDRPAP